VAPTTNATLTYDGENRLISVTNGATTVSYVYDSQSRRVARAESPLPLGEGQGEGAQHTLYLYDGWNCLADYVLHTSSFNLHTSFSWGLDLSGTLQGAGGVGGLLAVTKHQAPPTASGQASTTHFSPTFDGNGNVSEYLDASGSIAAHYEYDPFGRTIVSTGPNAADFEYRFSTKPVDAATGLYYYGYRWYAPDTGRWINRDPIEESGGLNLYGFGHNSSLLGIDLLGREWVNPFDLIEELSFRHHQGPDLGNINPMNAHLTPEQSGTNTAYDPDLYPRPDVNKILLDTVDSTYFFIKYPCASIWKPNSMEQSERCKLCCDATLGAYLTHFLRSGYKNIMKCSRLTHPAAILGCVAAAKAWQLRGITIAVKRHENCVKSCECKP
jgi:RHS repeat-associated protein